jgi:hypothetical protein
MYPQLTISLHNPPLMTFSLKVKPLLRVTTADVSPIERHFFKEQK